MYVFQKKGKPGWFAELNVSGRRARPRAGDTREQAERIAALADDLKAAGKSLEQIMCALPWPKKTRGRRGERLTFKMATGRYLESVKDKLRPSTFNKRRQTVARLVKARWATLPIEDVRPRHIMGWAEAHRGLTGAGCSSVA